MLDMVIDASINEQPFLFCDFDIHHCMSKDKMSS